MLKLIIALHQSLFFVSQLYLRLKRRICRGSGDEMPFALALTLELTWLKVEQRMELEALGSQQPKPPLFRASPVDLSRDRPGLPYNVIDLSEYRPEPARLRPTRETLSRAETGPSLRWAFGVMVLTCLALMPFLLAPLSDITPGEYTTGLGEHRVIPLSDGSLITMNTQSRLRVRFSEHGRYIDLLEGEAIFSVARDPLRPFRVQARRIIVEAVGTEFSVYIGNSGTKIAVTQGRVKVFQDLKPAPVILNPNGLLWTDTLAFDFPQQEDQLLLHAGQEARVNNESFADFEADTRFTPVAELQRHWAWANGNIIFAGETLSEVVAELNRYSWRKLKIADPRIAHYQLGGLFNTTDTETFLSTLDRTLHISSTAVGTPGSDDVVIELRSALGPNPSGPPP